MPPQGTEHQEQLSPLARAVRVRAFFFDCSPQKLFCTGDVPEPLPGSQDASRNLSLAPWGHPPERLETPPSDMPDARHYETGN